MKKSLLQKRKKELSDEEKEYKSLTKKIQEKLIKFATENTCIYVFDRPYREVFKRYYCRA